jgi:ABC-type multidrug transport system fused ATPase/permease subunit
LSELEALNDLLEALAITRQFFKTMALQQDFAKLSRLIISLGLAALLVAIAIALVYRTDATTVPPEVLGDVVSVGIGVVLAPLAAFVAYLARAATIAYRTVSVGPFVPPSE